MSADLESRQALLGLWIHLMKHPDSLPDDLSAFFRSWIPKQIPRGKKLQAAKDRADLARAVYAIMAERHIGKTEAIERLVACGPHSDRHLSKSSVTRACRKHPNPETVLAEFAERLDPLMAESQLKWLGVK